MYKYFHIGEKQSRIIMISILLAAIVIRSLLVAVNQTSNDNHIEVAQQLLEFNLGKREVTQINCRECFHPKLYHLSIAYLIDYLKITDNSKRIILAQSLNTIAGILTILIILLLLNRLKLTRTSKLLVFAIFALNPSLIFMDVQASNDSWAVLFAALTSYLVLIYFEKRHLSILFAAAIALSLGLLSKGTVLPILIWGIAILLIDLVICYRRHAARSEILNSILGLLLFSAVPTAAICFVAPPYSNYLNYVDNAVRHKSFGASHFTPMPFPHLFERSLSSDRPGVISIYDSYFTFRFVDLVRNPYITNGAEPIPFHRTSLWSQLYGRFHFSYFAQWGWARIDRITTILGRYP